jgi:hypothetical protein
MTQQENFNLDALMSDLCQYANQELQKCGKSHIEAGTFPYSETETCWIDADRERLRQIISILLDDAVKYIDSGFIAFGYFANAEADTVRFFVEYSRSKKCEDDDLPIAEGLIKQIGSQLNSVHRESGETSLNFKIKTTTKFTEIE